jgi:hypothetical protein
MKRRDVLLLRTGREREAELSCERLYMRYVDAEADGSVAKLFESVARELRGARAVRLTHTSWLAREDFAARLEKVLEAFVAHGGAVVKGSTAGTFRRSA